MKTILILTLGLVMAFILENVESKSIRRDLRSFDTEQPGTFRRSNRKYSMASHDKLERNLAHQIIRRMQIHRRSPKPLVDLFKSYNPY